MATGKNKKNLIPIGDKSIAVYASPRISAAMEIVIEDMNLIKGVKLAQVLEAVYAQGKKDGARAAFDAMHLSFKDAEKAVPHRNPGKPKKKKP
ncbi:hypothetical protein [uncultured Methylibium sp.]|uniref:hypothetical protein n=1 Tax=uncultured Methylibium sp. TaxID=381093 RepID=UPI0025CC341C|nr:hypothetical protein [uncultured Methylibium sp.]